MTYGLAVVPNHVLPTVGCDSKRCARVELIAPELVECRLREGDAWRFALSDEGGLALGVENRDVDAALGLAELGRIFNRSSAQRPPQRHQMRNQMLAHPCLGFKQNPFAAHGAQHLETPPPFV